MRYTLDSVLPIGAFEHIGDRRIKLYGGGGSWNPVNIIEDAVSSVSDALASIDPGPAIGDAGVAIDQGVNDVIPGGWATVGAAALAAATYGASLAAEGAIEGGVLAADAVGTADAGWSAAEASNIAAQQAAEQAALTGSTTALEAAPVYDAATAEALANGEISGLTSGAVDSTLAQGTMDATTIANMSADPIGTMNSLGNWTGLMTDNIGNIAVELVGQGVAEGDIASFLSSQYGIDEYAAANAAGMAGAGQDAGVISNSLMTDYGPQFQGWPTAGEGAFPITGQDLKNAYNAYRLGSTAYNLGKVLTGAGSSSPLNKMTTQLSKSSGLPSLLGGSSAASTGSGALPGNLSSTSLAAAPVTQGNTMNLQQLKQLYPQLSTIDPRLVQTLVGKANVGSPYSNLAEATTGTGLSMQGQGGAPSAGYPAIAADKAFNTTSFAGGSPLSGKFDALTSAGLSTLSGAKNPYGLKDGGQPHIPQFKTGTTGHYVQGAGDGQSDDIPAMLADGEYVFDADTVASLGNGSNKAGALQLDKMRESIRKHKRAAPHNKIPPKAKSPLEYMKGK